MRATFVAIFVSVFLVTFLGADPAFAWPPEGDNATWYNARRGDEFGATGDGLLGVGLFTGAAETSVPIAIPPGTGGVQPSLSLRYSSRGKRGDGGMGWGLDLGRIVRSTKYGTDRAQLASPDVAIYEFRGEELIRSAEIEGACVRYYPVIDLHEKILFCESSDSWIVRRKDGTSLLFGQVSSSRIQVASTTFEWALDEVRDTHGLSWRATWRGGRYLESVQYTLRNGTPVGEMREIDVQWLWAGVPNNPRRPDGELNYRYGSVPVVSADRITAIEVKIGERRVRKYVLTYDPSVSADSEASLLKQIQILGVTDGDVMPPMTFSYQSNVAQAGFKEAPDFTFTGPGAITEQDSIDQMVREVADLNGDGFPDRINALDTSSSQPYWLVNFGKGDGFDTVIERWRAIPLKIRKVSEEAAWGPYPSPEYELIDMTGDGLPDVLEYVGSEGGYSNVYHLYRNTGVGFVRESWRAPISGRPRRYHETWNVLIGSQRYKENVTFRDLVDLTGDGCPDLVDQVPGGAVTLYRNLACDREPPAGGGTPALMFEAAPITWNTPTPPSLGRTLQLQPPDPAPVDPPRQLQMTTAGFVPDVNGDGLTDFYRDGLFHFGTGRSFVLEGSPSDLPIPTSFGASINTILSSLDPKRIANYVSASHAYGLHASFLDMNADGRPDFVVSNADLGYWNCKEQGTSCGSCPKDTSDLAWNVYLNTGDGFQTTAVNWAASRLYTDRLLKRRTGLQFLNSSQPATDACGTDERTMIGHVRIVDFDGSGTPDVLRVWNGTWEVRLASTVRPELLIQIQNGLGGRTDYTWGSATGRKNLGELHFAVPVVSGVVVRDGAGGMDTTGYIYREPFYDRKAREFRGFGKVEITQQDAIGTPGRRTEILFSNGSATRLLSVPLGGGCVETWTDRTELAGRVIGVRQQDTLDTVWRSERWTPWEFPEVAPGRYAPRLLKTRALWAEANGQAKLVATRSVFDANGNLLSRVSAGETGVSPGCVLDETTAGDEVTMQVTWALSSAGWLFKPTDVRACASEACAGDVLRHRRFYYDGSASLGAVTLGDLTKVETWVAFGSETPAWTQALLERDLYGNVTRTTDEEGAVTDFAWADTDPGTQDSFTFVHSASATLTLGKSIPVTLTGSSAWNEDFGIATTTTELAGHRTVLQLDGLGRVVQVRSTPPTDPHGSEIVLADYTYSLGGGPASSYVASIEHFGSLAGESIESRVYFDGLGRPVQSKAQAEGGQWITTGLRRTYQGNADIVTLPFFSATSAYGALAFSETNPAQAIRHNDFDAFGRAIRTALVQPGGLRVFDTTTGYFLWDKGVTDPRGYTTNYQSDAYGRLRAVVENAGAAQTILSYDRAGNLVQIVDPIGATSVMRYDSRGLRRELEDPDTSNCTTPANCAWRSSYDGRGLLTSRTDAKGQQILFSRDELGRTLLKDYACVACSEEDVTFTWDDTHLGLLATADRGPGNRLEYRYDNWGRTTQLDQWTDDSHFVASSALDLFGRTTRLTYPTGELAEYAYNARGALERVTFDGTDIAYGTTYDALSRLTQVMWKNGLSTDVGYGSNELVSSLRVGSAGATFLAFTYRHDANGNPTEVFEDIGFTGYDGWSREYVYDWANRLTTGRHFEPFGNLKQTWTYQYDHAGNMTFNSDWYDPTAGLDGTYGYSGAGPHAVTRIGGATSPFTLAYDQNGSLVSEAPGGYTTYNFDGRASLMGDTGASTDPASSLSYDAFGDRRVRKVWNTGSGTKDLRYFGAILEELVEGAVRNTDRYVVAWGQRIAMRTTRAPGKTYFLHGDVQGSVNLVTDEMGAVVERRNYAPFGAPFRQDGTSPASRYGYTGQELDDEVGLLHLGIRQYHFAVGRFGSGDPIASIWSQGLNPYSYALNSPAWLIDPSGYAPGDPDEPIDAGTQEVTIIADRVADCVDPNMSTAAGGGWDSSFSEDLRDDDEPLPAEMGGLLGPKDLRGNAARLGVGFVPAVAVITATAVAVNPDPLQLRPESRPPGKGCGAECDWMRKARSPLDGLRNLVLHMTKLSDQQLKSLGIDAEAVKEDVVGAEDAGTFNLSLGDGGKVFLTPVKKGSRPNVESEYFLDELPEMFPRKKKED